MKKLVSVFLCLMMVFSLSSVAFAASFSFEDLDIIPFLEKTENGYRLVVDSENAQYSAKATKENTLDYLQQCLKDDSKVILVSLPQGRDYAHVIFHIADAATAKITSSVWPDGVTHYFFYGGASFVNIDFSKYNGTQPDYFFRTVPSNQRTDLYTSRSTPMFFIHGNLKLPSICTIIENPPEFEVVDISDLPVNQPHTLTVNYQYPDGTQAAESVVQSLEAGAEYNIPSPTVEGYRPDKETVSGTMPEEDLTVDVTYSKGLYYLTVKYQYEDGSQAFPDFRSSYLYGFSYSVDSPALEGYSPDKVSISGTMPGSDLLETVVYTKKVQPQYTLTISYQYEDGSQALQSVQQQYKEGESYSISTPKIEGYKADKSIIMGVMPGSDISLTVIYKKDSGIQPGPGEGGTGEGGNPWENIDSGPKYDPFHNPFSPENKGSSGSNPYLDLLNGIGGFKDPFISIEIPEYNKNPFEPSDSSPYSGYDPFHDPFNPDNVDSSGKNPFSSLWEMISGFFDSITGR